MSLSRPSKKALKSSKSGELLGAFYSPPPQRLGNPPRPPPAFSLPRWGRKTIQAWHGAPALTVSPKSSAEKWEWLWLLLFLGSLCGSNGCPLLSRVLFVSSFCVRPQFSPVVLPLQKWRFACISGLIHCLSPGEISLSFILFFFKKSAIL